MAKNRSKRVYKDVGDPTDPDGLFCFMQRFIAHLEIKHYTDATLWNNERYIRDFIEWCDARALRRPGDITKAIIQRYQRFLYLYRKADGQPLSIYSQRGKLGPLKGWFKWMSRENYILYNPTSEIELPRIPHRLPKAILTESEAEKVFAQINVTTPLGIRDRAFIELLYATGIRRMELVNLAEADIDPERGTVLIRQGKWRKDRMVPIGKRAGYWIGRYINEVRPQLVLKAGDSTLFLTRLGERFNECWLSRTVAQYVDKAKINKRGSCHLFRHTMATLMLENGADIRFIQAMLGHSDLSTTEIYTQVSMKQLKAVHEMTHPAKLSERMQRHVESLEQTEDETNTLLETLEQEAEEEELLH